jgi:hypothetical protein
MHIENRYPAMTRRQVWMNIQKRWMALMMLLLWLSLPVIAAGQSHEEQITAVKGKIAIEEQFNIELKAILTTKERKWPD